MTAPLDAKCGTGVPGLDAILGGGLPRNCAYLVEGSPGVGKTTLALQFLLEGVSRGERCLYVALSETRGELDGVARSHGWSLEGLEVIEHAAIERELASKSRQTMFQSAEIEFGELRRVLEDALERLRPARLALDSLSELRLLAQNPLRYRRQILAFKQRFAEKGCTLLLLDDRSAVGADAQVQSIVHGVLSLDSAPLKYGILRRTIAVTKLRGVAFREGQHDYVIERGGLRSFPRLVAAEHRASSRKALRTSGNANLDALLGGGLHTGTGSLLIGPAGSGKSTIATMFAHAAASRGERVTYYIFDESAQTLLARAQEMELDFTPHIEAGRLDLVQIDPAGTSPGELAHNIRDAVERDSARFVILDSLNGYVNAMPNEDYLHLHLHELLTYLNQKGVVTLMVLAQHGLIGPMGTPVDVSYLADTVVLTRFFEALGAVKKAISVIKKRSGPHESTIRELKMTPRGIVVGPPLEDFEGVLTGVPRFLGGTLKPAPGT